MGVYDYKWYPFLFLRSDQKLSKADGPYNGYPLRNSHEFSTGLYLFNTKTTERADGCKPLLPFSINSNQFAEFGDGSDIPNHQKNDGLYQSERYLIVPGAQLRLATMFQISTFIIENGHWEVDENGIMGGIGKFKEADTEEKFGLYTLYW